MSKAVLKTYTSSMNSERVDVDERFWHGLTLQTLTDSVTSVRE